MTEYENSKKILTQAEIYAKVQAGEAPTTNPIFDSSYQNRITGQMAVNAQDFEDVFDEEFEFVPGGSKDNLKNVGEHDSKSKDVSSIDYFLE